MFKKFIKLLIKSKKQPDMLSRRYEDYLVNIYGNCDNINSSISLLIVADTHGTLDELDFEKYLKNLKYDACIMLGDHYNRDIEIILKNVDKSKLYGLKGNHDYDYLSEYGIPNINGKIIQINNIKILGMEGSFKYNKVDFPSFTHKESIKFLDDKEKADILITHDGRFNYNKIKDPAHQGLIGITNYIYKNKVPIHIHGHIHENYKIKMLNGTVEYSIFGYELIKIGGNIDV